MTIEEIRQLLALQEATLSHSEIHDALRAKLRETHGAAYVWLTDVYDAKVIYSVEMKGQEGMDTPTPPRYFESTYSVADDGSVNLGEQTEVKRVVNYQPVAASESLEGDAVDLIEKAVAADDTIDVKLISPGWGSSGYYSAEVLKRDGPGAWPVGTHMHLDHPTESEKRERPEGSVKDLAAAIASEPVYQESGPAGPGLYAKAAVIPEYKGLIDALAPHIGVSIRAPGTFTEGEAEGRTGRIVKAIFNSPLHSAVDFVTKAGRGGQVLALMESWRDPHDTTPTDQTTNEDDPSRNLKENQNMDELQKAQEALVASEARVTELVAANEAMSTELGSLRESVALSEARVLVGAEVKKADLPEITKARLIEALVKSAKLGEDGKLDAAALTEAITESVTSEADYVAKLTESGKVRDQGKSAPADDAQAKLEESYRVRYMGEGYSEEQAKKMAATAAGR